jgi:enoyl-CoA hydratase/carnithine racemase
MRSPKSFLYEESGSVATLTLNRPEKHNALTFEVYRELTECFSALRDRPRVRVVVLTGAGPAFCSGGDVKEIIGQLLSLGPRELLEFTTLTCDLVRAIRRLPLPVVASLNGTVAGAGAALAIASDLRVAAEEARLAFLFVKVGLSGADMGVAHLLPRIVGLGRATELLMTGEFIDAQEAFRIGLYNRVVPKDRLAEETLSLVDQLSHGPGPGIAATKRALEAEMDMNLDSALELEARIQADLMQGPDFREGFKAFMERRRPRFEGAPE